MSGVDAGTIDAVSMRLGDNDGDDTYNGSGCHQDHDKKSKSTKNLTK